MPTTNRTVPARPRERKYRTLYRRLRSDIASGTYAVGESLPSVKHMMRDCGVSQATVMRALDMLTSDGLLERRPGLGVFVTQLEPPAQQPLTVWLGVHLRNLWEVIHDGNAVLQECDVELQRALPTPGSSEAPDIVTIYTLKCRDAAERHQLIPLDRFLRRDAYVLEGMVPEAVDIFRKDGHTWALPIYWSPLAAHLNLDLFEQMGVSVPDPEWTFDDLMATCRAFAEAGVDRPLVWGNQFHYLISFIFARGGRLYDPGQGRFFLDSTETRQAFEDLKRLSAVVHPPSLRDPADMLAEFASGRHPILFWGLMPREEVLPFRQRVIPMPGRDNTIVASSALGISTRSADPERAWEFIREMVSPAASRWTVRHGWRFPTTQVGLFETLRNAPETWPLFRKFSEVRPELYAVGGERIRMISQLVGNWWEQDPDLPTRLSMAQDALMALEGAQGNVADRVRSLDAGLGTGGES